VSYILDALKKSENERDREQGGIPDIQSIHNPETGDSQHSLPKWPYIAIISSLLVVIVVVFMWTPSESEDVVQEAELPDPNVLAKLNNATRSNNSSGKSANNNNASTSASKTRSNPNKTKSSPKVIFATEPLDTMSEPVSQSNTSTRKRRFNSDKVYKVAELPLSVRRNVPSISFTGHVYSSTPGSRSVMINDLKMREGQPVTSQLTLHEITQYGAVFKFSGYYFSLSALQDWKFN